MKNLQRFGGLWLVLFIFGAGMAHGLAPDEWPAPVGEVSLASSETTRNSALLDVGLVVFDPGVSEDATEPEAGIFPRIRRAEARFMPVVLRQALIASGSWGVVRVLPEPQPSAELLVTGDIIHSDGIALVLRVRAVDATGRTWLDRVYHDRSDAADYPVRGDGDPYADLYRRIANDLLVVRDQLAPEQHEEIRRVAILRYAEQLSPEAFGGYLGTDDAGRYRVLRLPAEGDPMLARVNRIRNQEHLFVDTIDEQYADLRDEMASTYNLWRQYGREQALYKQEYRERAASRDRDGRRGSFFAMQRAYDAYKWSKIHDQDLDELAAGFNNEVQPTVMQASGKVFRLSGTLESQYQEWQNILRAIFELEAGAQAAE